ncbi:MAG TPA: YbdK family carboxylate-amine ligase [Solirubrobacterales bacterium]|nr:YbdK family carboxylate-amine ligase [Solirubrobacterales bacterium]
MDALAEQPAWARWNYDGDPFTVGVEEEVLLLDPDGWGLAASGLAELRERLDPELDARLSSETHAATIEYETAAHASAATAAEELERLRARLDEGAREHGRAVAGSGTHPTVTWRDTELSDERRYVYLHEEMRELARREPTFAMHVHVGIDDPELAIRTANRMRVHLPLLLALSANSPFWQGRDSGLASARTSVFQTFPRVGIPRAFDDYADYVDSLQTLIACGAFPEPTFVWWDLRLQPNLGTLEIRAMDTQAEAWRAGALTALTQSLVRLEALESQVPDSLARAPELLDENRFRAGRDGVRAELLDPVRCARLPVAAIAELAVEACRPHARDLGCEAHLDRVEDLVADPADRVQRRLAGSGDDLEAVVEGLSELFSSSRPAPAADDRRPARSGDPPR